MSGSLSLQPRILAGDSTSQPWTREGIGAPAFDVASGIHVPALHQDWKLNAAALDFDGEFDDAPALDLSGSSKLQPWGLSGNPSLQHHILLGIKMR